LSAITVTLLHDYDDSHFEVFCDPDIHFEVCFCDPSRYSLGIECEILSELENDWFPIYLFFAIGTILCSSDGCRKFLC